VSRKATIPQAELDALRAVANAARHLVNVPNAVSTKEGYATVAAHLSRQRAAWRRLEEAVCDLP
jgi:hypothetical protein